MPEKKEILIVEDEEILLKLQSLLLTSRGYLVKGMDSGKQALAWLAKRRPDLVILDITKGEMDVFELCRKIKSESFTLTIPVIILSSRQSSEEVARGESAGADCLISKPFKASLLVDAVYRLASGKIETQLCFS